MCSSRIWTTASRDSEGEGRCGARAPPAGGCAAAPVGPTVAGVTTRGPPGSKESSPLPKALRLSGAAFSASVTTFSAVVVVMVLLKSGGARVGRAASLAGRAKPGYRARDLYR